MRHERDAVAGYLRHLPVILISLLCFVLLAASTATAQMSTYVPGRLLVKLRAPLAGEVETALSPSMELRAGQPATYRVQNFMTQHQVQRLAPLYPELVKAKLQRGISDRQLAEEVQQKFPSRATRSSVAFDPPEISRTYVLELDPSANAEWILSYLGYNPDVEFAEQDQIVTPAYVPNDPYFISGDLWGMERIGAPVAWDTTAADGIVVAVVDTGIDYNHPDLASNVWHNPAEIPGNGIDDDGNGFVDDVVGWDFISDCGPTTSGNDPIDVHGHGTHVAGTIAALGDNGIGVVGVAWRAKVMALRAFFGGWGCGFASTVPKAIVYAANNGADVIDNSWSAPGNSKTVAEAITYAYQLGAVIVAAAGNNNHDDAAKYYPGNLWNVITVAASDRTDYVAPFSNWGSSVDLTAPGVDILSLRAAGTSLGTPVDDAYTRADGTSMAAAHVAGLAALILAQHPEYSNEQVRQVLRVSAQPWFPDPQFPDPRLGFGRVDAAAALRVQNVLQAKIMSPSNGARFFAPISVSGIAQGAGFARYTLEYAEGIYPPTTPWTLIQSGTNPVAGGTLGTFDPTNLLPGTYTVRLTAFDSYDNAFVDRIQIVVPLYVAITSPAPPRVPTAAAVFRLGDSIPIAGTVLGKNLAGYDVCGYYLTWAEGINPSSGWKPDGLTPPYGSGCGENFQLGSWSTASFWGLTQGGYYTIRLSVCADDLCREATTVVYLEPDLLPGWPQWLPAVPGLDSGLVPLLRRSDDVALTMATPQYSNPMLPSIFEDFRPGFWPATFNLKSGSWFQPAIGNFTPGGPFPQQAIAADSTSVSVLQPAWDYPYPVNRYDLATSVSGFYPTLLASPVVMQDLDGDGVDDMIALAHCTNNCGLTRLFAWKYGYYGAQQVSGLFPIDIRSENPGLDQANGQHFLVADINGDGKAEVLVQEGRTPSTFVLWLFASDGYPMPWFSPEFNGYPDQMVLADLDHNGQLEILLLCNCDSQKVLHVLQPDGTERRGWPVALADPSHSYIAVGDLNRDGQEEIVVTNYNYLYVFRADGMPMSGAWPRIESPWNPFGMVVLADIDGDGRPEILTTRDALMHGQDPLFTSIEPAAPNSAIAGPTVTTEILSSSDGSPIIQYQRVDNRAAGDPLFFAAPEMLALNSDNQVIRSWSLLGASASDFGPWQSDHGQPDYHAKLTVGDFDNDGQTDIAIVYPTISGGGLSGSLEHGVATVLTTRMPYHPEANDWPMMYQNPQNTAVRRPDLSVSITSPSSNSNVEGSIVITAVVRCTAGVAGLQFQVDGQNMGPEITAAPYEIEWDTTNLPPWQSHVLTAVLRDSTGRIASSAPVTVVVEPTVYLPSYSSFTVDFGAQLLGSTSAPQEVTLTNDGLARIPMSALTITGDFAQWNNCGTYLAVSSSCVITLTFTPTDRGSRNGTLFIENSRSRTGAPNPPVNLAGTGQAMLAGISPETFSFGGQLLNSVSVPQTISYTNTGDVPLLISGVSISGDFAQTNNCGTSLASGASCVISVTFAPTARGPRTGTLSVSGDVNATATLSGMGQVVETTVSPLSLNLGYQTLNTTSNPLPVTLTNTGDVSVAINNVSVAGDFAQTNDCGATVAAGATCTLNVTFTPASRGTAAGTVTIAGDFPGAPSIIALSGTGQALIASASPETLTFGGQLLNSTSAAQAVTFSNTGDLPVSVTGITTTGDFAQTNDCGASLAAGANCTVNVTFTPTARGSRSGVLAIAGSVNTSANLSGIGQAMTATVSPESLTFGGQLLNSTSAAQNVTFSNTGDLPVTLIGITTTGDFAQTSDCGASLAAGANCTVNVTFTPTARGSRSGTLAIAGSVNLSAALSGSGQVLSATASPATLNFGGQLLNTSSAVQTVAISNTGDLPITISGISATGDFVATNNCESLLAVNATCNINVTFTPTATGLRSGTLTIASNNNPGIEPVTLSGTGTAPAAAVSTVSLGFGSQKVSTVSAAQMVTLTNPGTATLSISGISITGDFSQSNNCGASVAPGGSCTIGVIFAPTVHGSRTGTLTVASNAQGPAPTVTLTGDGTVPVAGIAPAALTFASQLANTTSAAQPVTLNNSGDGALAISSIAVGGDFAPSNNCGALLAPGATCTINVVFIPTTSGIRTGTLTVVDDSTNGSTQTVSLNGTGVDYMLSASPVSVSINDGNSANYNITVKPLSGSFTGTVVMSCSGLPAASTCTFNPVSVIPGSNSVTTKMTIRTTRQMGSSGTPAGTYTVTAIGTSGATQHSVNVTLIVK